MIPTPTGEVERIRNLDKAVASFTIIVTDANALIAPLHERMPVVLAPEDHEGLDPKNQDVRGLAKLLQPLPSGRDDGLRCEHQG